MKVTVDGREVFVRWKYTDNVPVSTRDGKPLMKQVINEETGKPEAVQVLTKQTSCIASLNGETLHEASVKKYHLDPEDKDEARKHSLKKLLDELYPIKKMEVNGEPSEIQLVDLRRALKRDNLPNKKARYEFWKAYMNRRNPDHIL